MLRSGTPVANYRAAGRGPRWKFVSRMSGALEEGDDSAFWLELLSGTGVVPVGKLKALQRVTPELVAIFGASQNFEERIE